MAVIFPAKRTTSGAGATAIPVGVLSPAGTYQHKPRSARNVGECQDDSGIHHILYRLTAPEVCSCLSSKYGRLYSSWFSRPHRNLYRKIGEAGQWSRSQNSAAPLVRAGLTKSA